MLRKLWLLLVIVCLVMPLSAQDATPETEPAEDAAAPAEGSEAAITITDQASVDGMVIVENVTSPGAGFIAIHVDMNGQPGPTVGVAPVAAGENAVIPVMIDVLGATPALLAVLHTDDGTPGVYEFEMRQMADPMVMNGDQPVAAPFNLTAVRVFDQQLTPDGGAIVGSVITVDGGWIVIHADEGGQPGPVLGQAPLVPGTNPAVIVPLAAEGQTPVLHAMLHVDDNEIGVYEFGTVEGADAPVTVNDAIVMAPFNVSDVPVILTAAGTPLEAPEGIVPALTATNQTVEGVGTVPETEADAPIFTVDSVLSAGPGWIDVHADAGGHPGASLGVAPVAEGENAAVEVPLTQMMTAMPQPLPPAVWPMLHTDDGELGAYEYLMIPGVDLPVVVNGTVVTLPVTIGEAAPAEDGAATEEAAAEGEAPVEGEATEEAAG